MASRGRGEGSGRTEGASAEAVPAYSESAARDSSAVAYGATPREERAGAPLTSPLQCGREMRLRLCQTAVRTRLSSPQSPLDTHAIHPRKQQPRRTPASGGCRARSPSEDHSTLCLRRRSSSSATHASTGCARRTCLHLSPSLDLLETKRAVAPRPTAPLPRSRRTTTCGVAAASSQHAPPTSALALRCQRPDTPRWIHETPPRGVRASRAHHARAI